MLVGPRLVWAAGVGDRHIVVAGNRRAVTHHRAKDRVGTNQALVFGWAQRRQT